MCHKIHLRYIYVRIEVALCHPAQAHGRGKGSGRAGRPRIMGPYLPESLGRPRHRPLHLHLDTGPCHNPPAVCCASPHSSGARRWCREAGGRLAGRLLSGAGAVPPHAGPGRHTGTPARRTKGEGSGRRRRGDGGNRRKRQTPTGEGEAQGATGKEEKRGPGEGGSRVEWRTQEGGRTGNKETAEGWPRERPNPGTGGRSAQGSRHKGMGEGYKSPAQGSVVLPATSRDPG